MSYPAIDAQFNRAVDIVQSLPKGGPVQTTYEEKLCLYSLYKQATEGDITVSRPGMLDMLGRAKWDSWRKQKGTDKTQAKQRYVAALLKILRKHASYNGVEQIIAEIEAFTGLTRVSSSASSSSSYHSSQASPPESDSIHTYNRYLPPDPQLPIPDVAPDIVPPSALTSSHRSLLNLLQTPGIPSEPSLSQHMVNNVPTTRQGSLRGGSEGRKGSVSSVRYIRPSVPTPAASQLGSVHEPQIASGSRPYLPLMPAVRDYGTPDMASASHLGVGTPAFPRPQASPSIYSQVHPAIPQTLQQIQISLTAIHERLSTLERTQSMLLRREARRKSWKVFSWGSGEADELDEIEDEAYRAKWGKTTTATTTQKRPARGMTIRAIWVLLTAIRRVMVDLGVGVLIGMVVVVALGGGWGRARGTLTRLFARTRKFIRES